MIPSEFGKLTNLQLLCLTSNHLHTIPIELYNLPNL